MRRKLVTLVVMGALALCGTKAYGQGAQVVHDPISYAQAVLNGWQELDALLEQFNLSEEQKKLLETIGGKMETFESYLKKVRTFESMYYELESMGRTAKSIVKAYENMEFSPGTITMLTGSATSTLNLFNRGVDMLLEMNDLLKLDLPIAAKIELEREYRKRMKELENEVMYLLEQDISDAMTYEALDGIFQLLDTDANIRLVSNGDIKKSMDYGKNIAWILLAVFLSILTVFAAIRFMRGEAMSQAQFTKIFVVLVFALGVLFFLSVVLGLVD